MTVEQIRNTIGSCVIGLTRHVMKRDALPHDEAYCKVFRSELLKRNGLLGNTHYLAYLVLALTGNLGYLRSRSLAALLLQYLP